MGFEDMPRSPFTLQQSRTPTSMADRFPSLEEFGEGESITVL